MPTTKYIWDPVIDAYLMETDGSDATQVVYTGEPAHFGRIVSQRRTSTTNYLHQDALGSTRQLTGSAKTTTDSWIYDAWGNEKTRTGSTANDLLWFGELGYYADSTLASYSIRARSYVATIARWRSRDPLFQTASSLPNAVAANNPLPLSDPSGLIPWTFAIGSSKNLYAYVRSRPIDASDPSGLIWVPKNCASKHLDCMLKYKERYDKSMASAKQQYDQCVKRAEDAEEPENDTECDDIQVCWERYVKKWKYEFGRYNSSLNFCLEQYEKCDDGDFEPLQEP